MGVLGGTIESYQPCPLSTPTNTRTSCFSHGEGMALASLPTTWVIMVGGGGDDTMILSIRVPEFVRLSLPNQLQRLVD